MAPGHVTLASLRTRVRRRADMVHSQFVTDAELNDWLREAYSELRDLLVQSYGEDYFAESVELTADGVSDSLPLPDDFFKLLGVDIYDGGEWRGLRRFSFNERNLDREPLGPAWWQRLRYRLRGNSLWFSRPPDGGTKVRLWYVPRTPELTDAAAGSDLTVTVDGATTGDVLFTAVTADGSPPQFLLRYEVDYPGVASGVVNVPGGATDTGTAENLADVLGELATGPNAFFSSVTSSGNVVSITINPHWQQTVPGFRFDLFSPSNGHFVVGSASGTKAATVDGVNGWEEYLVVDAAIKALQKEESDVSVLLAQKALLQRRIESAATNRDAAEPARVVDVTVTDVYGGW